MLQVVSSPSSAPTVLPVLVQLVQQALSLMTPARHLQPTARPQAVTRTVQA